MENQTIIEGLKDSIERLNEAQKVLYNQAIKKAETERLYRLALSQEIVNLRAEGHSVALIGDIARGSCANEKFQRDLADSKFRATLEVIETIKTQISAMQTIYRHND